MKKDRPEAVTVRPKQKHATLLKDLQNLAENNQKNFNDYVETILVRHVRRMSINQDVK